MIEHLKQWDLELFVFLNNLGVKQFDSFWIFSTQIESWIALFLYFFILIFYFYKGKKGVLTFILLWVTFILTIGITQITKETVARLRPNNVEFLSDLIRVLQHPTNYSFFSGHAAVSFAITTFMVLSIKSFSKWIYFAYLWPIIFVTSRIYVGVHYPSDILVGAIVGTTIAYFIFRLQQKLLLVLA